MFAVVVGGRYRVLTDRQWELLELLLPKSDGRVGRNFSEDRVVVEGMLFRLWIGALWWGLPEVFGGWQRRGCVIAVMPGRDLGSGVGGVGGARGRDGKPGGLCWWTARSCGWVDAVRTHPVAAVRAWDRMVSCGPVDRAIGRSWGADDERASGRRR
ncbi:transposase [Nocardia brasiliensis]|uniref:transposase n=1 Tax=Nocardia brasiliensis TaxID=37326 RepID=UPI003D7A48C9